MVHIVTLLELTNAVWWLSTGNEVRVEVGDCVSESFGVTKGLKQHCGIAPAFLKIYMYLLTEKINAAK